MRVLLTGATGFIGSRILPDLLAAGHRVIGLTRSDRGAESLAQAGAEPHRGTLEDLESLRAGAAGADAVIHCAFDHDFSRFVANCEKDRRAIAALGGVLKGSERPLLITSGVGMGGGAPGIPAREDVLDLDHPNPRSASEQAGMAALDGGVDVRVVRLPQVHDTVKQGLITPYIAQAREKGLVAYLDAGTQRWPAAHVLDVARLYVQVLDRGRPGARYHAVAEEGVAVRDIAAVIGAGLKLPVRSLAGEEAARHFGWLGLFMGLDMSASSAQTRQQLGWQPAGPDLISDLKAMDYSTAGLAA